MSGLQESGNLWHTIQAWLLPALEDEMGELDGQTGSLLLFARLASLASTSRPIAGSATAQPFERVQGVHLESHVRFHPPAHRRRPPRPPACRRGWTGPFVRS